MTREDNGHRRRTLRARVLRAQSNCAWCGKPVDKTLHHLDPMAPQIDHIVAIDNGGSEYDFKNLQLCHRTCNREKWNRPVTADLRTSQNWF